MHASINSIIGTSGIILLIFLFKLVLGDGANVTFLSNHAAYSGGAIMVVSSLLTEDMLVETIHTTSQNCFFQFSNISDVSKRNAIEPNKDISFQKTLDPAPI